MYFRENSLKWKDCLEILQNSEVRANHQIPAIFSFSVKVMCFRQVIINLSNENKSLFNAVVFI